MLTSTKVLHTCTVSLTYQRLRLVVAHGRCLLLLLIAVAHDRRSRPSLLTFASNPFDHSFCSQCCTRSLFSYIALCLFALSVHISASQSAFGFNLAFNLCSQPLLSAFAHSLCSKPLLTAFALSLCSQPLLTVYAHSLCSQPFLTSFSHSLFSHPFLTARAYSSYSQPLLSVLAFNGCPLSVILAFFLSNHSLTSHIAPAVSMCA